MHLAGKLKIKLLYENALYRKLHNNVSVVLIVISPCVEKSARLNCTERYDCYNICVIKIPRSVNRDSRILWNCIRKYRRVLLATISYVQR